MKGQRLFVRPLIPDDFDALRALGGEAEEWIPEMSRDREGLVGRIAGSTVAALSWQRAGDAMEISWMLVAPGLRGLRIGRTLLDEAATLASSQGATELRVERDCKLARYFERCGFVPVDGTLTRRTP